MLRRLVVAILLSIPAFAQGVLSGVNGDCSVGGQQAITSGLPTVATRPISNPANVSSGAGVMASYPLCQVKVYNTGTITPTPIFADNLSTPTVLSNPFTANTDGTWTFFVATAHCVDIVMSSGIGPSLPASRTLSDVCFGQGTAIAGVTSLNTLTGDLILAAGTNITITPSGGNTLTIACPSCSGGGGGLADPGANGIIKRTALNVTAIATASDVVSLFSGCSGTQYLGADNACHTPPSGGGTGFFGSFTNWQGFRANANNVGILNNCSSRAYAGFGIYTQCQSTGIGILGATATDSPAFQFSTSTSPGNLSFLILDTGGSTTGISSQVVIRGWPNQLTNTRMWMGLAENPNIGGSSDALTNAVAFRYSSTTDTTWKAYCGTSGPSTIVDTGVTVNTSPHTFTITNASGTFTFAIDGTNVATISTNCPVNTAPIEVMMIVDNKSTANATLWNLEYAFQSFVR